MLGFEEGGKPENPEKHPGARARTNIKLNPHMTRGPVIELGTHWGRRALSPLRHPCSHCFPNNVLLDALARKRSLIELFATVLEYIR